MSSILNDIKELANLSNDDASFDMSVIMYINTLFAFLNQEGIGSKNVPYAINDAKEEWDAFSDDPSIQVMSRLYISSKTKLLFDPPITVAHIEALKNVISETEYRLQSYIIAPPSEDGI